MIYARGLDGVRALAVIAVFVYHLGTTGAGARLSGGFLGVDVFFVLSGYLITSLLIIEVGGTGRISIKSFYLRRARRLLPALYALLLTVGAIVAIWLPFQAARLRGDLVAAFAYVTNWWLISEDSSYFDNGGQSTLLTHLWSLAVEEQFYLVWPLVMLLLVRWRLRRSQMLLVSLLAVALSTLAAVMLYHPFSDPSRVYYGTDTRVATPMIGVALAFLVKPQRYQPDLARAHRIMLDTTGMLALLGLGFVAFTITDSDPGLYRGGMLAIALLAAGLVLAAGHPATWLGKILGAQPLRCLGTRSYAVYLWHWPIFVLTPPNVLLRTGLTLAAAEASHWLVERPVRELRLLRLPARAVAGGLIVVVAMGAVGWRLTSAAQQPVIHVAAADPAPDVTIGPLATTKPPKPSTPPPTRPPRQGPLRVAVFGDSQGLTLALNRPIDVAKHIEFVDETVMGCGILLGTVTSRTGERNNFDEHCGDWPALWAGKVSKDRPDVALIVIGAWDVFDLQTPQGTLVFGSREWDANWSASLNQAVEVLRASGAKVALSLVPCYRPVQSTAGYLPERGNDDRTRHVNELLRLAAASDPESVFAIEPPAAFCADPAIASNAAYRPDGVHYHKLGAALWFREAVPQLLALSPS